MFRKALLSLLTVLALLGGLGTFQLSVDLHRIHRGPVSTLTQSPEQDRQAQVDQFVRDYVAKANAAQGPARERMRNRAEIRRAVRAEFPWMWLWQVLRVVLLILMML
ncbi:hypothetical protein SH661x_000411 [Planctomicrobium sp. SH661]|uniref:hypothetical protein n=1 Tax=Planctomicrobium sp. SH661 TaxID=3448124 RepID=UPI003F5C0F58